MRIAVTGGSGFIGQATVRAAENAGHDVWTFDRSEGHDVLGDLSALSGADVVIHLAGVLGTSELFDNPEEAVNVNVTGSLRVIKWCHENGAGYVGISMHDRFPSIYSATKVAARKLASAYHAAYDLPVSHVRAFNAYGPGQAYGAGHPQKILPTFARLAWEGRPIPIWGDGEQTVDLVHVDDVGRMLIDATQHGDDAVFDAGTGETVTVNEVARRVLDTVRGRGNGVTYPAQRVEAMYLPMRIGETPTVVVAKGEGWDRLDWKPELDWDRVADTVRWYKP